MQRIFLDAGYETTCSYVEDTVHLVFLIEPTAASVAVMRSREHAPRRARWGGCLALRSVAVVEASRTGQLHEVRSRSTCSDPDSGAWCTRSTCTPTTAASIRAYPSVQDVPDDIDLAILAIPATAVPDVVAQCAKKQVLGLVVMSGGC